MAGSGEGSASFLPGDPTLETLRMRLILPRVTPGSVGVYPPVFSPSKPGYHTNSSLLELRTQ